MLARLLCAIGWHSKPKDTRFLWLCERRHCRLLMAPIPPGKR